MPLVRIFLEVNGLPRELEVDDGMFLLEVLRSDLGLTGTKNGCGQGHCGACTVIVDGTAVRSCIYKATRAHGKKVETIEGLKRGDKLHPLQVAFVRLGAVQCGFCTSGMIMAAKALLDRNPHPSDDDIKAALKFNLCRCTGYVKIIEAVRAAAEAGELRADAIRPAPERNNTLDVVGKSIPREEAYARVTGEEKYTADLRRPGMLHARALRSRYPHAKILRVDVERARIMPGVVAVMTAADVPGAKNHGMVQKDWPAIAYDKVRYIGDSIAIVAAETEAQAGAALEAIEVDYETLPVITSPEEGLAEGAERVHEGGNVLMHIQFGKGDIDSGFAESDLIVESTFRTPASEHAYLEPEASLAEPDPATGGVIVYVGSQVPFEDREDIAACLALPLEKVRVMHMPTGGAFGGKEDICCQVHAALLAVKTGRPVMMVLSRSESIRVHPKRHATVISLKTGVSRDGRVLAQKVRILGDTGAYASLGIPVMTRAATHSIGPYAVPNVAVECYAVFTNNPPAGAYRGFGVTQVHFAAESQMDIIAQRVGISPFDIRLINALDVGEATSTGQVLKESVGLRECLERLRESIPEAGSAMIGHRRAWGIAAAYKNVGLGNGLADTSEAIVGATQGGRVLVRAGAAEVGQGHDEVLRQIVAEVLGLGASDIDVVLGDTGRTPDSGATTASRHTFVTGNAAKRAANLLKDNLRRAAASALGVDPAALRFRGGRVFAEAGGVAGPSMNFENVVVSAIEQGISIEERYLYTPPKTVALGQSGDSHFSFGFGAQAALVDVDIESGEARVLEVVAAHDVGQAINPMAIEGQVEGGIVMGMGFALTERFVVEGGYVKSDSLAKYKIPDVSLTPKITSIIVEHPTSEGPFGAKGVGEITSIPTAPAIANAIYNAVGIRFYELPIDRMALKTALDAARSGAPL